MFKINEIVRLKDKNYYGKITKINKEKVSIYCNNKTLVTNIKNIEKVKDKDIQKNDDKNLVNITYKRTYTPVSNDIPELMIRHMTLDEAMYSLEIFISECISQGIYVVKIVHGKHGGILRKATHDYLKNNKNIESFRLGGYYEGQYGVTIVNIKH